MMQLINNDTEISIAMTMVCALATTLMVLAIDQWQRPEVTVVQANIVAIVQAQVDNVQSSHAVDRQRVLGQAQRAVDQAVGEIAQRGVVVVASQAIVAGHVPDATASIEARVEELLAHDR